MLTFGLVHPRLHRAVVQLSEVPGHSGEERVPRRAGERPRLFEDAALCVWAE